MNERVLKLVNNMPSFKKRLMDVEHNYNEFQRTFSQTRVNQKEFAD
jgi:hypothetical protein